MDRKRIFLVQKLLTAAKKTIRWLKKDPSPNTMLIENSDKYLYNKMCIYAKITDFYRQMDTTDGGIDGTM